MRSALLALLLVLAPLSFVPIASAGSGCWVSSSGGICCAWPDPVGQPGSPGYLVTSLPGAVIVATCSTVAIGPGAVVDAVDCIVFHTNC